MDIVKKDITRFCWIEITYEHCCQFLYKGYDNDPWFCCVVNCQTLHTHWNGSRLEIGKYIVLKRDVIKGGVSAVSILDRIQRMDYRESRIMDVLEPFYTEPNPWLAYNDTSNVWNNRTVTTTDNKNIAFFNVCFYISH